MVGDEVMKDILVIPLNLKGVVRKVSRSKF